MDVNRCGFWISSSIMGDGSIEYTDDRPVVGVRIGFGVEFGFSVRIGLTGLYCGGSVVSAENGERHIGCVRFNCVCFSSRSNLLISLKL